MRAIRRPTHRGTVLPMLGVCLISIFGFVALAVDLGMLAVARTQCQNAADYAALIGCRNLNNAQPGNTSYNNNLSTALAKANAAVPNNILLGSNFTSAQIQSVTAGIYSYNTATQTFVVSYPTTLPAGSSWSAMQVVVNITQPTYFMKVFGVTSMPNGATAVAVYRPRDTAFVLDMTGSMRFASRFNYNGVSMNADTMVPSFGHYVSVQSNLIQSSNQYMSDGEVVSRNNFTMTTPGGPPIVRNFYSDPANFTSPATSAYPVTSNTASLINAFQRWSPPETPGNPTNYVPQTYDFTGYNPANIGTETTPTGPVPAPYSYQTMTDSTSPALTYVGDRYRRLDGSINYTDTTWAIGTSNTQAATTALDLLGYGLSGSNVLRKPAGSNVSTNPTITNFRDAVWEQYGYDMDIKAYRTARNNGDPLNPSGSSAYTPTMLTALSGTPGWVNGDRFRGFSMGPGYWGKTFYIWPPDPRFSTSANLTSPNPNNPAFDTSGNAMCDWRKRFFLTAGGAAFASTANVDASVLTTSSGTQFTINGGSCQVNYPAVLAWLTTGPMVLPPNLRAGRILYYSSIPTAVTGGTGQVQLDQVFWKNYIDYVLGTGSFTANAYTAANLYGVGDSWSSAPVSVNTSALTNWTGPSSNWTNTNPYKIYSNSPLRPRMHMWFGPLSMMDFIANVWYNQNQYQNWTPGTAYEAQCWQLKAGMNSVLLDIQANHPNDQVGMTMFSMDTFAPPTTYQTPKVGIGQNFTALQNALFYPSSLLSAINGGDTTSEIRPYDTSLNSVAPDAIPNASCGTDPNTGLAIAFNILSPSSLLSTSTYGTTRGRQGASKIVIFETDGVPNCYSTYTLNQQGYNTYYSNFANGGDAGNGASGAMNPAIAVVTQMALPMATTATNGLNSGLALGNAPVRVYPIGFGDIFDPVAAPNATFRPTALQFLANIAAAGGTGVSGATTITSNQIITGPYATRIANLQSCLQQIFQSGVSVTLVQ